MSTISSPRSDWFSGSSRIRRPSKASPVTSSSSEVHVDAQPSYGASPEGRAHSRQTLSKHLSQSKLGVESDRQRLSPDDTGRPRSGSSVSVTSTTSTTASSTTPARNDLRSSSSTLSTPTGSPSVSRRRSSAAGPASVPRSPSWYQSTSRKSSLALPTLSTIEGSIADLRVENNPSKETPDEPVAGTCEQPSSNGMKRDRTGQEPINPKQPKRQATDEDRHENGTPNIESASATLQNDSARSASPSDMNVKPASSTSQATTDKNADGTLRSWRSYLTLPRPSKSTAPSETGSAPTRSTTNKSPHDLLTSSTVQPPKETQAVVSEVEAPSTVKQMPVSSTAPKENGAALRSPSDKGKENTPSTKLDLRAFAAGTSSSPNTSKTSSLNESTSSQNDAMQESSRSDATLRPAKQGHARPTSWWGWPAVSTTTDAPNGKNKNQDAEGPEGSDTFAQKPPVSSEAKPIMAVNELQNGATSTNAAVGDTASDILLQNDNSTWSAWLGSYLAKPVETTSITYAAGVAPSITSSVASSIVPDADETSPPPPADSLEVPEPINMTPSPTLQRINPLLDVMPRSTWSSFFASRILPTQKTIDNKPSTSNVGEVETMEIDFGSLAPSEIIGPSVKIAGNNTKITSPMMRQSSSRSSAGGSKSAREPPRDPAGGVSSPGSATPTSQISTIKPLTKDKKVKSSTGTSTSTKGKSAAAVKPAKPNIVLPTFEDIFERPPRSLPPARAPVTSPAGLKKAVTASLNYLFSSSSSRPGTAAQIDQSLSLQGKDREIIGDYHERLPKSHGVAGSTCDLQQNGKVAVIGVHGWFIQTYLKNVVGEPTGTSTKFATMMKASVKAYYAEMGCPLNDEAITAIPLEGDGTVKDRTERLYENLMERQDWIEALNNADRIFVASHSQGTIVSTMLIERLINEGEINGTKCMLLNMCSVSQGPFYSLYNSWTVPAYLYFETAAATELFEFQKPRSAVSKAYTESLQHILNAGVKILFVASLNDQVVPLYSALFSSLSHPNILRTIFIDSSVFDTNADFMTNLVVFSTRLRNAGVNCHGLDFHLSEALMGSLVGVGHSSVYEEAMVYKYAVRYLMETSSPLLHGQNAPAQTGDLFQMEDFNPRAPANPYYLPWALRGIIEDQQVRALFSEELQTLRDQFEVWQPKTKALQQVQAALEPLRLIPRSAKSDSDFESSVSKTDKKATAKL